VSGRERGRFCVLWGSPILQGRWFVEDESGRESGGSGETI